jgi:hypothetical protein
MQFEAQFVTDKPFFQVCHFLCTPKLPVERHTLVLKQDTAQPSELSWPFIKQYTTQQILLYIHLPAEICVSCSNIAKWSVQKLSDHTMYISITLSLITKGNMKKSICTLHIFSDSNQSLAAVTFVRDGNSDL